MGHIRFYSDASFTLQTSAHMKLWSGTLYDSTDTTYWYTWEGATTLSAAADSSGVYNLYLKGINNTYISENNDQASSFVLTGTKPIYCEGNIENLLDESVVRSGQHPTMDPKAFYQLFINNTLLRTPPELPATTLTNSCYLAMFYGCTSLIKAPELPATTLADSCYYGMFYGCTNLKMPPKLPATTLADWCYNGMFYGCTSLVTAPELPATTLFYRCYSSMFASCTNLKIPPNLPATTLEDYCYAAMFYDSGIKLNTIQHKDYTLTYRIPNVGTGTTAQQALSSMFSDNEGVGFTPEINTTYYVKDKQYKVGSTELIVIADKIRNSNNIETTLTYPDDYIEEINKMGNSKCYSRSSTPSSSFGQNGDIYISTTYLPS